MSKYICYNGELRLSSQEQLFCDNRSFLYGDGFFETIRCLNSVPLFFSSHYYRILTSLDALEMEKSEKLSEAYLNHQIVRLLQNNRIYKGARARITFFRNSGGLYTPDDNSVSFIITVSTLSDEYFQLRESGLNVGIYSKLKKPVNELSALKTTNALFYILAGKWKKENSYDDCLLMNLEGKIIEGLSSNIFLIKDKVLFATTDDCGCVQGVMRRNVLEIANSLKIRVVLVHGFTVDNLIQADEILFTNAIQGINFVSGFQTRRYYNRVAKKLIESLNILVQKEIKDTHI